MNKRYKLRYVKVFVRFFEPFYSYFKCGRKEVSIESNINELRNLTTLWSWLDRFGIEFWV